MVWGMVRVVLFSTAFFIGTTFIDTDGASSPASPQAAKGVMAEKAGTSLVVACDGGNVTVKRLTERGAVQFDCARSNMVVVRDHERSSEKVPRFHPMRHELQLLFIR